MRSTVRRGLLAAALTAVLATIVVSSNQLPSSPHAPASIHADELLVYENGFCQVIRSLQVTSVDSEVVLDLPAGTLLDTLRIEGLELSEMIGRDAAQPFLPGDHVVVDVGTQTLEGRIVAVGERFVLETENGTKYLDPATLRSIAIMDATQPVAGQTQVRIRVRDDDGPHSISINYLLRGLSWHANHELDVETGDLRTWATITGSPGLAVDRLVLVSGAPRFVISEPMGKAVTRSVSFMAADERSGQWSSATLDEYHEYALDRSIDLAAGREVHLVLFANHLDVAHELVGSSGPYTGSIIVDHRWSFTNPSNEPLPRGPVAFYRAGRFIGQDSMAYLPRSETVRLVSGHALDIKASVSTECIGPAKDRFEIQVTNRKSERATVRIEFQLPSAMRIEAPDPSPVWSKAVASWSFTLEPDGTGTAIGRLSRSHSEPCLMGDR